MAIIALITWLITAALGATMLGLWVRGGGPRAAGAGTTAGAAATAGGAGPGGAGASGVGESVAAGATSAGAPGAPAGAGGVAVTNFVPGLVFGHFLLAAVGLVLWIWYVVADVDILTWISFVILLVVAVLGELLFMRWRRGGATGTIESHFPKPVVYAHGVFAVITLLLVLIHGISELGE